MKEHVQKTGVRKYAGDDLIELQAEPLAAVQGFFEEYGNCIIKGCEVVSDGDVYNVTPGLLALQGNDPDGDVTFKVVPFSGIDHVTLPLYFTLTHSVVERAYGDGKVKPIAYDFRAAVSAIRPEGSCLELTSQGGRRFVDAVKITEKLEKTGNGKDVTVTFAQAADQANVASGDKLSVLFGKVRKWFASLGNLAFKNSVTIAEVDALQTTLNTKADKSSLGALASKDVVAISEVTNLQSTLDAKANASSLSSYIPLSQKGANSGVATLDGSGKVVTAQLPLGETASTAYRGDRGKIAYDYSQATRTIPEISGLQNALNSYLPLSGGTINSSSVTPLILSSSSNSNYILFKKNDNNKCYIGLGSTTSDNVFIAAYNGDVVLLPSSGKKAIYNNNEIVTTNDPRLSDARPANGGAANMLNISAISNLNLPFVNSVNNRSLMSTYLFRTSSLNIPSTIDGHLVNDGFLLNLGWDAFGYNAQLAIDIDGSGIAYRGGSQDGTPTAWKMLAFTSDIPKSLPASDVSAWAKAATKPLYNFAEIYDAAILNINAGIITRTVLHARTKTNQGFSSRVALGLLNPANSFSPAVLSVGTNDAGSTWVDYTFGVNGRITSPIGSFALTSEIPTRTDQIAETDEKKYITATEKEKLGGMMEVICAGEISKTGAVIKKKGGFLISADDTGIYSIIHNYGSTDYIIQATGSDSYTAGVRQKNTVSFVVIVGNGIDYKNAGFSFIMYKI